MISDNYKNLIFRCNSDELPDNVVGAAVMVNSNKVDHAGIFIKYNGEAKLFHFINEQVTIDELKDEDIYFLKELTFVDPILTPSFLAHCEIVLHEAKPKYGYFYIGAMYDENGKFLSPGDQPEYMTCVGFCLNFLKYFSQGIDVFEFENWDSASLDRSQDYIEHFIEKVKVQNPSLNIEDFRKGIRRIWPVEYFAGAFSDNLPVKKEFIDLLVDDLSAELASRAIA